MGIQFQGAKIAGSNSDTRRPHTTRLLELDGIRAIAIAMVIGCHYKGFASLLYGLPTIGWLGVDIFFVLSGFLITSILLQLRGTALALRVFYIRRFLRIFPVYFLCLGLISIASVASHEHILHTGFYINRILFLQSLVDSPNLFHRVYEVISRKSIPYPLFYKMALPSADSGATVGPWANSLSAAWSLSIEEYFYVLWAPVVLFLRRRLSLIISALFLFLLSIIIRYLGFSGRSTYYDFFCRLDMLMAGSILALFMRWRDHATIRAVARGTFLLRLLGLLSAGGFAISLAWERPFVGRELRDSVTFMIFGLSTLSIFLASGLEWIVSNSGKASLICRFLRIAPLRYIGMISYSIYLFHIPVYEAFVRLSIRHSLTGQSADIVISIVSAIASITFAVISWKYFEKPILSLKDRWAPSRAVVHRASRTRL